MARTSNEKSGFDRIPFRMHPRVFAALGADLVTNDVVAVIELVKNSYDAFARNVWLRFRDDPSRGAFLEIEDDGNGMTRDIIEQVWCLVATPFKEHNPLTKSGQKVRRVAGEKGLGRLSVARLGERLDMLTQAPGAPCWEVNVNWSDISAGDDLSGSYAECRSCPEVTPFEKSGTLLRILGLKGQWDNDRISDLEDNLARLISPFSDLGDFNIFLSGFGDSEIEEVKIESPEFLAKPKYSVSGGADGNGNVRGTYRFAPISGGRVREKELKIAWEQIYDVIQDRTRFRFSDDRASCGPFTFEIRAWDIAADDTQEIAERFDFQKSQVRKAIRAHKGISVYRNGVLVLPKSDNARDWLGLDLRRVSKVGTRLSTSQVVGYVSITAEDNPRIEDTSDRERLASCIEVAEFEEILKAVVALLENERDEDRIKPDRERPMDDLFAALSAEDLVAEVIALSDEGADASEAIPLLRAFSSSLDAARKTIQERFIYYSRLATVGTIAQMLVHEIRNRTTAFGSFLDFIKNRFGPFKDKDIEEEFRCTDNAVNALERLADTFAPLASRGFRRRKRQSILEDQIRDCLALHRGEIEKKYVRCNVPDSITAVAVDPGELDAIILNLVTNAVYWMGDVPKENRELEFRLIPINNGERVRVWIHDTGPGLNEEDVEKVFWPGVTRKPGGIGMGLTVASELVAAYGGRMSTKHPGTKGGASFAFDLPLRKQG
ncbi:GHKL domain protein [uncultured Desulfobacterium sp.]|uniref:histidine kinase n=1 Tax=uncultured Desulfobacterium sp. TaxID=201089 RepID=A0A445MYJ1_9BACT|nr:GHKL domain protein [uncultured Desulfobacterium sp.]